MQRSASMHGVYNKASTYLGFVVVLMALNGKRGRAAAFPLALCVCVYGIIETLLRDGRMKWPSRAASLVGHIILPLVCMLGGYPNIELRWVAVTATILLCVLFSYIWVWKVWPYVIDVPCSLILVVSILLCLAKASIVNGVSL